MEISTTDDASSRSSDVSAATFDDDNSILQSLPAEIFDSDSVARTQTILLDGLRHALLRIAEQRDQIEYLRRQIAADKQMSTPDLKAPSLPSTPPTVLLTNKHMHCSSTATPAPKAVVSASCKTAATAASLHPPLVRLEISPVAPFRGQGGMANAPPSKAVAMCQTPGSWLLSASRRSQKKRPIQNRPSSLPSPVAQLFASPDADASARHDSKHRQLPVARLQSNPIRPPRRPPPPRPASPVQPCSSASDYESAQEIPDQPVTPPAQIPVNHRIVMQQVQERRLASMQLHSKILVRSYFNMWRAASRAARNRRPADDEASVGSGSWRSRRRRGGHRQRRQRRIQHSAEPHMHSRHTQYTNKDFPFFNVRGACISCGSGWLLGYWRRQPRYGYRGARAFDPLDDKIMCDTCRHDHPLGPFYFPDYYSYVTDDAIRRVQAEADGACPADAAKQLYKSQLHPAYDSSSAEEQQMIPPPSAHAFDCAPLAAWQPWRQYCPTPVLPRLCHT
jgi:hypothetical protein